MNRSVLPINQTVAQPSAAVDVRDQDPPYEMTQPVRPPDGAPNVLLVVLDDVGFGATSTFGGPCRMPAADQLAEEGLRYTRFHTAALCAPTRAALLTGRNPHSCGMGALPEFGTAAPGYTGVRPRSTATIARVLQCNGYATGAFGKMHQTPLHELGPSGSFEHWPTNEGFDRFYGFLGFDADQFHPTLIDGVTQIEAPETPEEGYHLSEDLVDKAISWVETVNSLDPERPWFTYLSFGACHAPLQVPDEWLGRYKGQFDDGWNDQRERTIARQKELGVIPQDAQLSPWPEDVPPWDDLDDSRKSVAARLMEVYAAFAEHTDAQVQRMIDALERLDQRDNTLIVYLLGDNGAAAEAGIEGSLNYVVFANGFNETPERMLDRIGDIGTEYAFPGYPVGWALAMDTPYQWTKTVASHYGGTRNGLVISWPKGLGARGGEVRNQWHHCIDLAPTILELAGLPEPTVVDGAPQRPLDGVSMAYTFKDPDADERRTTQYFEVFGNRGIYHRGWTAVTKHHSPWSYGVPLPSFSEDVWELYDTNRDWTQARNVAAEHPAKLEELKQRFLIEAAKHQVLPLDDRSAERLDPNVAGRPDPTGGRRSFLLRPGMPGLREGVAPDVKNRSFAVTAIVDVDAASPDGVLVAQGGRFGGWSVYVSGGRVCYCHNYGDVERMYVRSDQVLASGRRTIEFRFEYDGGAPGKGGTGTILVDAKPVGRGRIERTTPLLFSGSETLDVGIDRGTPVTEEYGVGRVNAFAGEIESVRIDLGADVARPSAKQRELAAVVAD